MHAARILRAVVFVGIILILALECVDGRGGRGGGGGGRGGSRGGASRSGSSTRYRGSSSVRYYRGPVYRSSMWKTGLAVGTVYGLMSYKRRRLYLKGPDREPRVCYNEDNLRNGTYGYFICPEPDLPDNYDYCCGDEGEQECCTYTKYKEHRQNKAVGGIIGGIVGVVFVLIIVAVCVYCCVIKERRGRRAAGGQVLHKEKTEATPMQNFGNTPVPPPAGAQPYAPQPVAPPVGFDGGQGGLPYNPSPMGPPPPGGQYPPPAPAPVGPAPIGFKDGADGLPYSMNPNPYPPPAPGPGGFVEPIPPYSGGPMDPNAQPPPYGSG